MSEKFAKADEPNHVAAIDTPQDLLSALGMLGEADDDGVSYYRPAKATIKAMEFAKFGWPTRILWVFDDYHPDMTRTHTFTTRNPENKNTRILCHSQALVEIQAFFPSGVDLKVLPAELRRVLPYFGEEIQFGGTLPWIMAEYNDKEGVVRIKAANSFNEAFRAFIDSSYDPEAKSAREFVASLPLAQRNLRKRLVKRLHTQRMAKLERQHTNCINTITAQFEQTMNLLLP